MVGLPRDERLVVAAIGEAGEGKSTLLNLLLNSPGQDKEFFAVSEEPDSCTLASQAKTGEGHAGRQNILTDNKTAPLRFHIISVVFCLLARVVVFRLLAGGPCQAGGGGGQPGVGGGGGRAGGDRAVAAARHPPQHNRTHQRFHHCFEKRPEQVGPAGKTRMLLLGGHVCCFQISRTTPTNVPNIPERFRGNLLEKFNS